MIKVIVNQDTNFHPDGKAIVFIFWPRRGGNVTSLRFRIVSVTSEGGHHIPWRRSRRLVLWWPARWPADRLNF